MAFADKLKALRLENNMTQEYVAERTDHSDRIPGTI